VSRTRLNGARAAMAERRRPRPAGSSPAHLPTTRPGAAGRDGTAAPAQSEARRTDLQSLRPADRLILAQTGRHILLTLLPVRTLQIRDVSRGASTTKAGVPGSTSGH
jgi:hypothetical protein